MKKFILKLFFISLCAALLMGAFIISIYADNKSYLQIVGWVENTKIIDGNLILKSKLDTGARNSSLNVKNLKYFEKNDEIWVSFNLSDGNGNSVKIEKKIIRIARIKRFNRSPLKRPVILMALCIGKSTKVVEVSLQDRRGFIYPLLVGRSFLAESLIVDSSSKYLTTPTCEGAGTK